MAQLLVMVLVLLLVGRRRFEEGQLDSEYPMCVGQFGGYLYLNMSLTRIYGVRMPGMTPEMVDFQYFGEMPGIPPDCPTSVPL